MRLSELQNKDVISIIDGKKIGNIIDIKIEESGKVVFLVVEPTKFNFRVFSSKEEFLVGWNEIEKIGEDVILVRTQL